MLQKYNPLKKEQKTAKPNIYEKLKNTYPEKLYKDKIFIYYI